mgnify:CR=1 FL=1
MRTVKLPVAGPPSKDSAFALPSRPAAIMAARFDQGAVALAVYLLVMGELLRGPVTLLATLAGFAIAVTAAYALVRQLRRPD